MYKNQRIIFFVWATAFFKTKGPKKRYLKYFIKAMLPLQQTGICTCHF